MKSLRRLLPLFALLLLLPSAAWAGSSQLQVGRSQLATGEIQDYTWSGAPARTNYLLQLVAADDSTLLVDGGTTGDRGQLVGSFLVPEVDPGPYRLRVVYGHQQLDSVPFGVTAAAADPAPDGGDTPPDGSGDTPPDGSGDTPPTDWNLPEGSMPPADTNLPSHRLQLRLQRRGGRLLITVRNRGTADERDLVLQVWGRLHRRLRLRALPAGARRQLRLRLPRRPGALLVQVTSPEGLSWTASLGRR